MATSSATRELVTDEGHRDGRADARHRLDGEHVAQIVPPGAAVGSGNRDAEQTQAGGRLQDAGREPPAPSIAAARGATTSIANCSIDSWNAICSGVSSKSIVLT